MRRLWKKRPKADSHEGMSDPSTFVVNHTAQACLDVFRRFGAVLPSPLCVIYRAGARRSKYHAMTRPHLHLIFRSAPLPAGVQTSVGPLEDLGQAVDMFSTNNPSAHFQKDNAQVGRTARDSGLLHSPRQIGNRRTIQVRTIVAVYLKMCKFSTVATA